MLSMANGRACRFAFIDEKALQGGALTSEKRWLRRAGYADRMSRFHLARSEIRLTSSDKSPAERVEDIPDQASPSAAGFKPPEFLNRTKPEYTDAAERADVTATVEASVVFRSNGEVGDVQITRWAGFGLDESAEKAIRQLKFKPATRGLTDTVRAIVQSNFRGRSKPNPRHSCSPNINLFPTCGSSQLPAGRSLIRLCGKITGPIVYQYQRTDSH